jgi:hypothetical protein
MSGSICRANLIFYNLLINLPFPLFAKGGLRGILRKAVATNYLSAFGLIFLEGLK